MILRPSPHEPATTPKLAATAMTHRVPVPTVVFLLLFALIVVLPYDMAAIQGSGWNQCSRA